MRVKFAIMMMLSLLVVTALHSPVSAQIADTGCDPEYMDALEARSWYLGQRRVSMNNNLILKPDSIIEYSCFNEALDVVAAAPYARLASRTYHDQTITDMHMLFSESGYWGDISSFTEYSTDSALQAMVGSAMVNYLDDNFMHYYLSTRVTTGPAGPPSIFGVFDCISLSYIWHIARCMEFMDESDLDGFYDFPYYNSFDPRMLPPDFGSCPGSASDKVAHLNAMFNDATNAELYTLADDFSDTLDGAPYEEDPIIVEAHLPLMLNGDCSGSPRIPTGITVERQDGAGTYDEHFCTLPGCSYDGAECVAD